MLGPNRAPIHGVGAESVVMTNVHENDGDERPSAASSVPRDSNASTGMKSSESEASDEFLDEVPEDLPQEDIAALMKAGRTTSTSVDRVKPRLQVSSSGTFHDQFYRAQEGSRAMAMLKNRQAHKQLKQQKQVSVHAKKNEKTPIHEQFSDSDILKRGYLIKQGSFWKTWHRRFFLLRSDRPVLAYYSGEETLTKLGEMQIDKTTTVTKSPVENYPHRFIVKNSQRELKLIAEDGEQAMNDWVSAIARNIDLIAHEQVSRTSSGRISNGAVGGNQPRTSDSLNRKPSIGSGPVSAPLAFMSEVERSPLKRGSIQRNATDSRLIQMEQEEHAARREGMKLSDTRNTTSMPVTGNEAVDNHSMLVTRPKPRSLSADSVLLTQSNWSASNVKGNWDDTGLLKGVGVSLDEAPATRAQSLSLARFRPTPSIELAVSVGSKGTQQSPYMLVVVSSVVAGQEKMLEVSRTEVQSKLSLRSCGADFFARDFHTLLSIPLSTRGMLHFEIFSLTRVGAEGKEKKSLGFMLLDPMNLLFSREPTLVLQFKNQKASQRHFLTMERIVPSATINLGHSYAYAKRHFIADTAAMDSLDEKEGTGGYSHLARGQESDQVRHLHISEELSASYCGLSVAVAYLKMMQDRNASRVHQAQEFLKEVGDKRDSGDQYKDTSHLIDTAQESLDHYLALLQKYKDQDGHYRALLTMLEEGLEPGVTGSLKRSVQKKDKTHEFMPINLNCHLIRAHRIQLSAGEPIALHNTRMEDDQVSKDEFVHAAITHGAPAAHCLGYKDGGLRRLRQDLNANPKDKELTEKIERREDVVRCQALGIASAAFLSVVGLASNGSTYHQDRLTLMCRCGFLLSIESLLSTYKSEKGMLEDMADAAKWLNSSVSIQLVQSMDANPKLKYAKCIGISNTPPDNKIIVTFAVPTDVFVRLPDKMQHATPIKIRCVLFSQGVNEMQSVANHMLDASLQNEVNVESMQYLKKYVKQYKSDLNYFVHRERRHPRSPLFSKDFIKHRQRDLAEVESAMEDLSNRMTLALKHNEQRKNVGFLLETSDLCRKLGAGRTTCCKSGKDRTAMSVTLEASQMLVDYFNVKHGVQLCDAMRERGVRRVNVMVNTGKDKYAFNAIQLKYLPDCYRPPVTTADSKVAS